MCVDLLIYIAFVKEVGGGEGKKFWGILVIVSLTAFSVLQFVAFENGSDGAAEVVQPEVWLSRGFCCLPSCRPGARKKKPAVIFSFLIKKNTLFFSEIHLDKSKLCVTGRVKWNL